MAAGGFRLRKWKTSDKQLQALIDKGENQMEVVNSGEKFESDDLFYTKAIIVEMITLKDSEQNVLGLRWDSIEDELSIIFEKVVILSDSLLKTNRNLLKLSASIFDPLGLISAVTVQFRILLQDICKLHLGWDTPLPQKLAKIWYELIKDLNILELFQSHDTIFRK